MLLTTRSILAATLGAGTVVIACNGAVATNSTFSGAEVPADVGRGGEFPPIVDAGSQPCDPLGGIDAAPTTLGKIVAAGRDANGETYVIDAAANGDRRLFFAASGTTTLLQQNIAGTGELGGQNGSQRLDVALDGGMQLAVLTTNGAVTRMDLHRGPADPATKLGTQSEMLTLLSAGDLVSFSAFSLEQPVNVDFDAVTPDGHHLFVTMPEHITSDSQYRVFYGMPGIMKEQQATVSANDATLVEFTIDGTDYGAYLPSRSSAPANGVPLLTLNGGTPAIQRIPLTYVYPAEDFDPNGGGSYPDGGPEPFATTRDASLAAPGAGLSFTCL